MKVDIICPLYNAENDILPLLDSLKKQKGVEVGKYRFVLTESKDKSEEILKENKIEYTKVSKEEFSHSKTREDEAMKSDAHIITVAALTEVVRHILRHLARMWSEHMRARSRAMSDNSLVAVRLMPDTERLMPMDCTFMMR